MSHLRAYHTEAYDKAGMPLPDEDFEETLGVGFPGHLQIGVAVSGCALYGIHGMAGLSLDYNNDDVGWYAGGGYVQGVCAGAGVDVEIAKVFSSNTLDDGGVSSGGSIGGDFGPGVDLFFDIDHDDGNEPSFAIGVAAGYGVGVDLSYVWTYEVGGCFGGCNKYGVDLCGEGRKSMQGSCIKDFDVRGVSPSCNMQEYDVNLMSVPGPHFLITAKQRGDFHGCPSAIVFASVKGMKYEVTVSKDIIAKFPIHHLGTAQLHSIVNAEQLAEPIDVDEFNLATNNCVHFAGKISRALGLTETNELATFIIEHTLNDERFEKLAKSRSGGFQGFQYLAAKAMGGKKVLEDHVRDLVYSQLIIEG